jgi:hypothetical protein
MPAPSGLLQRQCTCGTRTTGGGECAECNKKKSNLQRKLLIGASNDPLEMEADRVADRVLAGSTPGPVGGTAASIQRLAGRPPGVTAPAPASVDCVLASPGSPMEPLLRQDMEQRFGFDFSQVRVHSGEAPARSAREVNADAYTVRQNLVFGAGRFAPGTTEGRRLIAHELAHVVQQSASNETPSIAESKTHGRVEHTSTRELTPLLAAPPTRRSVERIARAPEPGLLRRQPAVQPRTETEDCDPALQSDLKAMHGPTLGHVDRAVASLDPGWNKMAPADKAAFTQYFDPSASGEIDDGFVRDVQAKFRFIRANMRSLRFDCDPTSRTLCGSGSKWCVGGRLMWTCFGNLHVCTGAYKTASPDFKIHTIIHESVHNALLTTDRAYSSDAGFKNLSAKGSGFFGRLLNFLGKIPVLGILFRLLPGNKDTINNPDSYAGYAMQV